MQYNKIFKKFILLTFIISTATIIFNGCTEDTNITPPTVTQPVIMVTHASPNTPNIDIYIGNTKVSSNVSYPFSTPYNTGSVGNDRVRVNIANSSNSAIDTSFYCEEGKSYSVFAIDSLSKITPLVLTDVLTVPGTGNSNVRFINLSPNGPDVDLYVAAVNSFPNIAFKEVYDFRALAAGTYTLQVKLAKQPVVIFTLPNVTFSSGKIYTVYLKGFAGGSGTQALGLGIINNN